MTLTVIFKAIDIGYNVFSSDLGKGYFRVILWDFVPENTIFKIHIEWRRTGDSHVKIFQNCRFYEYKIIMFKITPFYPQEYHRQIRSYMTLKIDVKVIFH